MTDVVLKGRVLQWGNSFGVRITRAELEAAGLRPGQDVTLRVEGEPATIDLSGLPTFRSGLTDVSERHDEYLGQALEAEWRKRQRAARRRH